jgi:thiamine-phosphate pyrophosphorylase
MTAAPACRLYLVTPPELADQAALAGFLPEIEAALAAGDVACVLLRTAGLPGPAAARAAAALCPVVQAREAAFLVEDRAEIARAGGCDGVHLSGAATSVAAARRLLGAEAIIGVGCGLSRHDAMDAAEAGADYVGFEGDPAGLEALLAWWQVMIEVPCVAMGPIEFEKAAALALAGADFLALGDAVWRHPAGPGAAVESLNARLAGNTGTVY